MVNKTEWNLIKRFGILLVIAVCCYLFGKFGALTVCADTIDFNSVGSIFMPSGKANLTNTVYVRTIVRNGDYLYAIIGGANGGANSSGGLAVYAGMNNISTTPLRCLYWYDGTGYYNADNTTLLETPNPVAALNYNFDASANAEGIYAVLKDGMLYCVDTRTGTIGDVTDLNRGIMVYDVSTPEKAAKPEFVGRYNGESQTAIIHRLNFIGDYLYASTSINNNLRIYRINPKNNLPNKIESGATRLELFTSVPNHAPGNPLWFDIENNYLYVVDGTDNNYAKTISVHKISDVGGESTELFKKSFSGTDITHINTTRVGDTIYIACQSNSKDYRGRILAVDISCPEAMDESSISTVFGNNVNFNGGMIMSGACGITTNRRNIFVLGGKNLLAFDTTNKLNPERISQLLDQTSSLSGATFKSIHVADEFIIAPTNHFDNVNNAGRPMAIIYKPLFERNDIVRYNAFDMNYSYADKSDYVPATLSNVHPDGGTLGKTARFQQSGTDIQNSLDRYFYYDFYSSENITRDVTLRIKAASNTVSGKIKVGPTFTGYEPTLNSNWHWDEESFTATSGSTWITTTVALDFKHGLNRIVLERTSDAGTGYIEIDYIEISKAYKEQSGTAPNFFAGRLEVEKVTRGDTLTKTLLENLDNIQDHTEVVLSLDLFKQSATDPRNDVSVVYACYDDDGTLMACYKANKEIKNQWDNKKFNLHVTDFPQGVKEIKGFVLANLNKAQPLTKHKTFPHTTANN